MSKKLLRHTLIFSAFVFLAQILGLVRDLYLVKFFGVGSVLDTYYLAFKVPDFLNVFYSVFLGSVIFIPLLSEAKHENGDGGVQNNINKIGSMVFVMVIFVSIILYIMMPYFAHLLAPSWHGEQLELLVSISRTLLLAQLFFPIGILSGAIGMVYEKPFGMASAGFTYNFFILLFAYFLAPFYGIFGVVYGVIFGAMMFALVQASPKMVRGFLLNFSFVFALKDWIFFFKRNFGRFISVFLNQTFWLAILTLASFAGTGGVTLFQNSFNIFLAIYFIIGASFSTALMPTSSRLHIEGNHDELKETLHFSLIYMFSVSLVISLFAYIFSKEIIGLVYYFSNIEEVNILKMAGIFAILCLSSPLLNIIEVIRKYMYTTGMILQSVIIMLVLLPTMFLSNYILRVNGFEVLFALPLSIFIANIASTVSVMILLNQKNKIIFSFIFKNIYKTILVVTLSYFVYIFSLNSVNAFVLGISYNFWFLFLSQAAFLFLVLLLVIFIINDKIMKNILRQIIKFVV